MPKEAPKITTRLEDTDYGRFPSVIDITMGEFAFSDFYPIHSDSYATCMGVVVGAVDGFGVCLAHLDPLAGPNQSLYKNSLDAMIAAMPAAATKVDVVFFKDGWNALAKFELVKYLTEIRHADRVREVIDRTDTKGTRYDEVVVMPSAFYSAYVCLRPQRDEWDWARGKRVLKAVSEVTGNQAASHLGRARRVSFEYTPPGLFGGRGTESAVAEQW